MEPDLGLIIPRLYLTPIEVPPCLRPPEKEKRKKAQMEVNVHDATRAQELLNKYNKQ